jgi:hypothetical protein
MPHMFAAFAAVVEIAAAMSLKAFAELMSFAVPLAAFTPNVLAAFAIVNSRDARIRHWRNRWRLKGQAWSAPKSQSENCERKTKKRRRNYFHKDTPWVISIYNGHE